jgi:hypothetical protein
MIGKIKLFTEIYKNMGARYFTFRASHEIKNRLGILKKKFPTQPSIQEFISLEEWRKTAKPFFFSSKEELVFGKNPSLILKEEFEAFQTGKIKFFNAKYLDIGRDYDWISNPDTNFKYDISKHWTEVNDFSKESGDIKFVWEKSRFSYLYTIIRYDYHFEKDCAAIVFDEIENWIDNNPINQGPNYKCSQEISLRTLNWIFALYYYKNSPSLTEALFQKIMHVIYWQLHHDYHNIHFSRIAVRNNHAITETMMLYLGGLLFPFFPDAQKWKNQGKAWFEEEILYQVYKDGTFLQFSHNYHRVLIQLFTWAFYLSDLNGEKFTDEVYSRAKASLTYLYQCQIEKNGHLPNYGANDGALFFKFNNLTYRDYRPQLNALHYYLNKKHLYSNQKVQEDVAWLGSKLTSKSKDVMTQHQKIAAFPTGGIYTIREENTLTFIKCSSYKDRPAHADNLHIDIWFNGKNILRDAGTYKYNTTPKLTKYFNGTTAHNTVTLENFDQMQKGPRFIWLKWSEKIKAQLREEKENYIFEGKIKAFKYIASDITHERKVTKSKDRAYWEIEDTLHHGTNYQMKQWWNISDDFEEMFTIKAFDGDGNVIKASYKEGFFSGEYGQKIVSKAIVFETKSKNIKTIIQLR